MPSPFPGMNPYLEQAAVWHDFHESFMPMVRELLSAQLLPNYFIKIDEHVFIHDVENEIPRLAGHGDVVAVEGTPTLSPRPTTAQTLEAPVTVEEIVVDEERISFLEIVDRQNRQVVTVIELLSPSNKYAGQDRNQYLAKRQRLLRSTAHFVEIDLLRGGPRMPWRPMPECAYCVVVSRVHERPGAGLWPIGLRDPLPVIPIPLKEGTADASLDLQQVVQRIYDVAGYKYYIYDTQPEPLLTEADTNWARIVVDDHLRDEDK